MRQSAARGQLNIEFILAILLALLIFTSLFSLYSSQARTEREWQANSEAKSAVESLGKAINLLSSSSSLAAINVSLPSGSYSLSLKSRRVVSTLGSSESTYPLITDSAVFDLPAGATNIPAGSTIILTKKNGAIHVSLR